MTFDEFNKQTHRPDARSRSSCRIVPRSCASSSTAGTPADGTAPAPAAPQ